MADVDLAIRPIMAVAVVRTDADNILPIRWMANGSEDECAQGCDRMSPPLW